MILGEIDGKQVYMNASYAGRTSFPQNMTALTISEAGGKKVKVKGGRLYRLFSEYKQLQQADVSGLDTAGICDMRMVFYGDPALEDLSGLEQWDVSSATSMFSMFAGCSSLRSITGVENWKTSSVTDMSRMFENCSSLRDIMCLTNWDVSSVSNMSSMFDSCRLLTDADLNYWETSFPENMNTMFHGCGRRNGYNSPRYRQYGYHNDRCGNR